LRDLTRYRVDLIGERGREKNRVEKVLEDAGIKVSVVASSPTSMRSTPTSSRSRAGSRSRSSVSLTR
jgi:flagellar biosynthesis/type III secretory pathway ATPase